MNELHRTVDLFDHLRPEIMDNDWNRLSRILNQLIKYFLPTKSPTPGILVESLMGNATRLARMMVNANDPKTAVMEKEWKIN